MIDRRRRRDCGPVPHGQNEQTRPVSGPGGTSVSPHDGTARVHNNFPDRPFMSTMHWKKFSHPGGVYQLEYPAHWEQIQKDGARSCGFGPHDRDDVGLWISLMPVSVDTDRLADELPRMLSQVIPAEMQGGNVRRDPTLRHH